MKGKLSGSIMRLVMLLLVATLALGGCSEPATTPPAEEVATEEKAPEVAPTEEPAPEAAPTEETAPEAPTEEAAPVESSELPDCAGMRVATIWGSLGNDFNVRGHQAAVETLEAMGCEVLDSNAGGDRNRQVDLIENAIQLQVDGMVMGDVAVEIIDPVITEAFDAGIPTVSVGASSLAVVNDVALDEFENGVAGARLIAKYLGDNPGKTITAFEPGYRPIELRYAAYGMAMPFLVSDYETVAVVNAHWPNTMPEAKAQMEALLRQYSPGEIDAVYATYDLEAIGMAQAIEEAGRDIPVVGHDASPDMLDWIARGSPIKGTIASDPVAMGKQAAINLVRYLQGESLPHTTYSPVVTVDLDNIDAYMTGGEAEESASTESSELPDCAGMRVATIWGSLGNDFNVRGHQTAVETLEAMGCEVLDSNAGGDRNRQVDLIENAIQLQVDGMVMGDVAVEIIDPVITEAFDAGIPTVSVGASSLAVVNDVALDEFENGVAGARLITKYLGDNPGKTITAFEPGYRPIELRYAAYGMAMPFLVSDYETVAVVNAHWPNTMPEAKAQMEALLRQYGPGEIDAVYATYDLEAIGMAQAIEEAGRDIPVVGHDASPDMLDWIARGSPIKGTIASDPVAMGKQAAINLVRYLQGESLPHTTYSPVVSVDLDNINEWVQ